MTQLEASLNNVFLQSGYSYNETNLNKSSGRNVDFTGPVEKGVNRTGESREVNMVPDVSYKLYDGNELIVRIKDTEKELNNPIHELRYPRLT